MRSMVARSPELSGGSVVSSREQLLTVVAQSPEGDDDIPSLLVFDQHSSPGARRTHRERRTGSRWGSPDPASPSPEGPRGGMWSPATPGRRSGIVDAMAILDQTEPHRLAHVLARCVVEPEAACNRPDHLAESIDQLIPGRRHQPQAARASNSPWVACDKEAIACQSYGGEVPICPQ